MKNRCFSILMILIITLAFVPNTFAQDALQGPLPEGAIARLGGGKGTIYQIQFSPNNTFFAVATSAGIWLYDAETSQEVALLKGHTGSVRSVSFSPDGRTLASGSSNRTVRLWDVDTGRHIRTLAGHTDWINSVSFSPDGGLLASVSDDNTIRLWDANTGRHIRTPTEHTACVESVSFSSDGRTLASGSWREIHLWDARTGTHLHTLTGHTNWVISVVFSPDGGTLASGDEDGIIRLWEVGNGRHIRTLTGHTDIVWSVAFSPDGRMLASGSSDNTVRLWNVNIGHHLITLTENARIYSVAFNPDGKTLASGGQPPTRLWNVISGTHHEILGEHANAVTDVVFSSDGRTLATGSYDGTVLLWALAPTPVESKQIVEDVNGDGVVNIVDLTLVAGAFGNTAGAPSMWHLDQEIASTRKQVEQWLREARQMNLTAPAFQRGLLMLEQLLATLTPKETALLPNYPNPFNPETWIPYQLAAPADVSISIYAADGRLVRTLNLGHQPVGLYESRSRAAYWDGRNALGEPVASGVYFYTLSTGDFTATRKMLIQK